MTEEERVRKFTNWHNIPYERNNCFLLRELYSISILLCILHTWKVLDFRSFKDYSGISWVVLSCPVPSRIFPVLSRATRPEICSSIPPFWEWSPVSSSLISFGTELGNADLYLNYGHHKRTDLPPQYVTSPGFGTPMNNNTFTMFWDFYLSFCVAASHCYMSQKLIKFTKD